MIRFLSCVSLSSTTLFLWAIWHLQIGNSQAFLAVHSNHPTALSVQSLSNLHHPKCQSPPGLSQELSYSYSSAFQQRQQQQHERQWNSMERRSVMKNSFASRTRSFERYYSTSNNNAMSSSSYRNIPNQDYGVIVPEDGYGSPCVIKVIGVGGGGGNAVNRMIQTRIEGVSFWAINTDSQALDKSLAPNRLNIGRQITRGLGAGGIPSVGEKAALENVNDMKHICKGADMVFITAGMGGGTGSGAAPVLAEVARDCGCLTVGVVTKPFAFEGKKRMKQAEEAIENLRKHVDTLIVVSNDKLLRIVPDNTPVTDAFLVADDILRQGVVGISEIIIKTGLVNVDFADVRAVMKDAGTALMGVGTGEGKTRAADAAVAAISSPLLDFPISEAKRIVFNVVGGPGLGLSEINAASEVIYENAHEDANIIFGALIDEKMGEEVSITVLACDFRVPDSMVLEGGGGAQVSSSGSTVSSSSSSASTTSASRDMRDPNFYKNRRQATKSPLGPDASLEETRKAITRGFKKPGTSLVEQEQTKEKKRGFLRGLLRKLTGRKS